MTDNCVYQRSRVCYQSAGISIMEIPGKNARSLNPAGSRFAYNIRPVLQQRGGVLQPEQVLVRISCGDTTWDFRWWSRLVDLASAIGFSDHR